MADEQPFDSDDSHTVPDEGAAPPVCASASDPTLASTQKVGPAAGKNDASTPHRIPGYRAVRKLGEGAFGVVWLYLDERTGVQVAVKFFAHGTGQDWLLVQAEVKQLALLHADPGIVQLRDVELEAKPPYYVIPTRRGAR